MARYDLCLAVGMMVMAPGLAFAQQAQPEAQPPAAAAPAATPEQAQTPPPAYVPPPAPVPATAAAEPSPGVEVEAVPAAPSCDLIGDAIIPLKPPSFNSMTEWRKVFGLEGIERLAELLALADGGTIALGTSQPYSKADGLKDAQLYVVRTTVAGKPVYDKRVPIKNFVAVAGALILKDKVIVLSQIKDEKGRMGAQLDLLDGAAAIKKTIKIEDVEGGVIAGDVVANADAETLTVAAMLIDPKEPDKAYTVLYRIDLDGKVLSRREFLPGVSTRIDRLQRLGTGQIVGAGRMRVDKDRDAGWMLLVSRQGDLVMQRPYARGGQAQFKKIIDNKAGGFYALGEAIPADGGYRAAWVMHLNANGNVVWQRFLSGRYRYTAEDLTLQKDGRLMVLMGGRPAGEGGREHARVVTLSSLGDILQDEAFIEGSNALPARLIEHSITRQRLLAGYAQTGFDDYGVPEALRLVTYDAWVTGLTKLAIYTDPCKPPVQESLDDPQ